MSDPHDVDQDHLDYYGDPGIVSGHGKIPKRLILLYIAAPLWGIVWWMLYWNGMTGWLDRGYWFELERAANTTFPIQNQNEPQVTPLQDKPQINTDDRR